MLSWSDTAYKKFNALNRINLSCNKLVKSILQQIKYTNYIQLASLWPEKVIDNTSGLSAFSVNP